MKIWWPTFANFLIKETMQRIDYMIVTGIYITMLLSHYKICYNYRTIIYSWFPIVLDMCMFFITCKWYIFMNMVFYWSNNSVNTNIYIVILLGCYNTITKKAKLVSVGIHLCYSKWPFLHFSLHNVHFVNG